jgi:hypothetical protein
MKFCLKKKKITSYCRSLFVSGELSVINAAKRLVVFDDVPTWANPFFSSAALYPRSPTPKREKAGYIAKKSKGALIKKFCLFRSFEKESERIPFFELFLH